MKVQLNRINCKSKEVENELQRELPIELQLLQVLQIPWTSMNILKTISRLAINQTVYWCIDGEF